MAELYQDSIRLSSNKNAVRNDGKKWLQNIRDKCIDEQCLINVYERRIAELTPGSGGVDMVDVEKTSFFNGVVYGIGDGISACEKFPNGVPVGLWGNREKIDFSETVSRTGRMYKITGTYPNGSANSYWFFRQQQDCLAAMKGEKIDQSPSANSARSQRGANFSSLLEKPAVFSSFLFAPLGIKKSVAEKKFSFDSCIQEKYGGYSCIAISTLLAHQAITMADGDTPCIVGKEIVFEFSKSENLESIMCETFPNAWNKINLALRNTSATAKRDVKQIMGMTIETIDWLNEGRNTILVHYTGKNIYGNKLDSYSILFSNKNK